AIASSRALHTKRFAPSWRASDSNATNTSEPMPLLRRLPFTAI
ncbi:hypothetical protein D027_1579B, partial [Vibrio parahaemolyticus 861]